MANTKTSRTFNSRMQARLLLVFCVVTLMLIGLMGRLIYINRTDGDRYAKQVLSRQSYVSAILPYRRGDILDRNGTVLATSELQYKLILDPYILLLNEDYIEPTMKALEDSFAVDREEFQKILEDKPKSQYVVVLKSLQYSAVKSFEALRDKKDSKITGVWFEQEYVRSYPYKTLACDVLGFTSADNKGFWGIEEYYNSELNGINGREYGYYDAELNIERIVKKAVNGNSVITTIDANVQRILQEKIIKFNSEIGSKSIGILVMNPNNGEILGMASDQEYDLNNPRSLEGFYTEEEISAMTEEQKMEILNTLWKNDTISSGFEPGSTFKPVTIAAALEEGIIHMDDTYYCDGGQQVGSSYIHCSKRTGHGEITLGQALMVSCNDALMQIAELTGRNIFYDYQGNLSYGQKTGIDLPGEEGGLIISESGLNATELATSSFGQSFTTTMVQMAAAFSSLVNGGYYYQPHVVKKIVNENGATVEETKGLLVRQTVSKKTSEFLQEYLYQTVEAGTAQKAGVEGYSIGGKTGTAEKQPRDADTYVVSFLGCAPAINPEMVIFVMIDEPQNVERQADSSIATKFASEILNEILPALGIYPDGEIDYLLPEEEGTEGTSENSQGTTQGTEGSQENGANSENQNTGNQNSQNQDTDNQENGSQNSNSQIDETGTEDDTDTGDSTDPATGGQAPAGNTDEDEFNPDALD